MGRYVHGTWVFRKLDFGKIVLSPLLSKKVAHSVTVINSQLLRCSTVRGAIFGLSLGGPTKVKARKSFLFTEGSFKVY